MFWIKKSTTNKKKKTTNKKNNISKNKTTDLKKISLLEKLNNYLHGTNTNRNRTKEEQEKARRNYKNKKTPLNPDNHATFKTLVFMAKDIDGAYYPGIENKKRTVIITDDNKDNITCLRVYSRPSIHKRFPIKKLSEKKGNDYVEKEAIIMSKKNKYFIDKNLIVQDDDKIIIEENLINKKQKSKKGLNK